MTMKSRLIASIGILVLLCDLGLAQSQQDALDVLNKVGETYRSTKTLQAEADVQTEMNGQGMEQKIATHMFLTLAAPGKFRVETKTGPARILMIADGQTVWMYFPELNKYSKLPVAAGHDSGANTLAAGLPGLGSVPDFSKVAEGVKEARMLPSETLQVDGEAIDCYVIGVLEETPALPGAQSNTGSSGARPMSETLWVDKTRLLVVRLSSDMETALGSSGSTKTKSTLTFSKLALDQPVPDDAFVFNPPQGATELDLTQFMPGPPVSQ
jgi:outer membrane lipoprotein-sorting protein